MVSLLKNWLPNPLKKVFAHLVFAGLLLLAAGTFFDQPIARMLYHPGNELARFMSAIAAAPCFWCLNLSALLFASPGMRLRPRYAISFTLVASIEIVGSLAYCVHLILEQFAIGIWPAIFYSLALIWCVPLYVFKQFLYLNNKARLSIGLYFMVCALSSLFLVNALKLAFARPRFVYLASDPRVDYQPWFQLWGRVSASPLVDPDWLRSFPSGHTAAASCAAAFWLIPRVLPHPAVGEKWWIVPSLVWIGLAALSRMVLGMHFLSDVAGGFLITICCIAICIALFYRYTPKPKPIVV